MKRIKILFLLSAFRAGCMFFLRTFISWNRQEPDSPMFLDRFPNMPIITDSKRTILNGKPAWYVRTIKFEESKTKPGTFEKYEHILVEHTQFPKSDERWQVNAQLAESGLNFIGDEVEDD